MTDEEIEIKKNEIRIHTKNLSDRFNELLWGYPHRIKKMRRFDPCFFDEFFDMREELNKRYALYLEDKIKWDGFSIVLAFSKDVAEFGRQLFCFVAMRTEKFRG